MLLTVDATDKRPIYQQIVDGVKALIARGDLREGTPLPTVRQVAGDLRVDLNTIAVAYRQLQDEGFLSVRHGAGTVHVHSSGSKHRHGSPPQAAEAHPDRTDTHRPQRRGHRRHRPAGTQGATAERRQAMNTEILMYIVTALALMGRVYDLLWLRWNLPNAHGPEFFMGVEVAPEFRGARAIQSTKRYHALILAELGPRRCRGWLAGGPRFVALATRLGWRRRGNRHSEHPGD